jgi:hypothetical protein
MHGISARGSTNTPVPGVDTPRRNPETSNSSPAKFLTLSPQMQRVLRWFGAASSFLFVWSCLNPTKVPARVNPIEDSWVQILHLAFARHLQFGREIVFTFGPWGFLYTGYRPETHWLATFIWLILSVIFWLALRQIARRSFKNELAQWLWIMGLSSVAGIAFFINNDVRFVCWPFLLLILHFFHDEPSAPRVRNALIVSLGLLSLVKFNLFVVGTVVILAIAAETVLERKRFPWSLPLFAASIAAFWLLARQKPSSFLPYLVNSWQVASGYTEAMMSSNPADVKYAILFTSVAFVLMAITALAAWKRLGRFSVFIIGAMGFLTFTMMKYGFVRTDHESEAALQMIAVSVICLAIIWPVVRDQRWWFHAASFLPIGLACLFTLASFHRYKEPSLAGMWVGTFSPSRWLGPIEVTYLGEQYKEAWELQMTGYRYDYQIPKVTGETDYYSTRQIELLAYDIPYKPRPVFQSYCAFTPKLTALNAAHLRSDNAPQFIVFDNFALDRRYPSLEDGLSWPELLTRYDVQEVELTYALLAKSKTPRKFTLAPLSDTSVKLGQSFSVPTLTNGAIWAEIEVNRTLAGSVISATFKPPMLFLKTTLRNGKTQTNDFLANIARAGFLLSPRVNESVWFAALGSASWPSGLIDNEVTSFSIFPSTNGFPVDCYQDSVRVRLFHLEFPPQQFKDLPAFRRLAELNGVRQRNPLGDALPACWPDEGSILCVSPDSHLRIGSPEGHSHLQLGFGLSLFDKEKNVPGVTFRASTLDPQNRATPLWSQHIDPKSRDNCSKQLVNLDLGTNEISNVLIETVSDSTAAHSHPARTPYWYQIHFE